MTPSDKRSSTAAVLARHYWAVCATVFVLLFAFYVAVGLGYGPIYTSDGVRDLALVKLLKSLGFDLFRFTVEAEALQERHEMPQPPLTYLLYYLVVAACDGLAGGNWGLPLVIFNALAYAIAGIVLLTTLHRLLSPVATAVVAVLLIVAWEYYQWVPQTQADALQVLIVTIMVTLIIRATAADTVRDSRAAWIAALIVACAGMLTKPTFLPWVAVLAVAFIALPDRDAPAPRQAARFRGWLVALGLAIGLRLLGHAWLIHAPERWQDPLLRQATAFAHESFSQGWVIWARPETYVDPPQTWLAFATISALRFLYFFSFLAEDFSTRHKLVNAALFVPLYALALVGSVCVVSGRSRINGPARLAGMLAILALVIVTAYHAVTILDYDWRYRAPVFWALFLLAAIGAERLFAQISGRVPS